jgi:predicted nucleotidyltransferase component of viral defense system
MARLREHPDDLFALVAQASEALGLPLEFVEKDFWITELLRSVARPVDDAYVVFKGGTSLSRPSV